MLDHARLRQTTMRLDIKMNTLCIAVAATAFLTLCGAAGAETMSTTKGDPLAVPVSGHDDPAASVPAADDGDPIGAQSAPGSDPALEYWTPERMRAAKPMETPQLDEEDFWKLLKAGKKNR
jgi:hypothetical protein